MLRRESGRGGASTPISDRENSLQGLEASIEFLREHAPYETLSQAQFHTLLQGASLRFFPAGAAIELPTDRPPEQVAIVHQGTVERRTAQRSGSESPDFMLGVGETLFNEAVHEQRPSRSSYRASTDTFLIYLEAPRFAALAAESEPVRRFCEQRASELLELAMRRNRRDAIIDLQSGASLDRPLRELASRPPLHCCARTPVGEAVGRMHAAGVGSIMITTGEGQLEGIFTLHDLRALVATDAAKIGQPIATVMTAAPWVIEAEQPAYAAAALMAERRIRHLPVTQDGRLWGVVSERDLFARQRGSLVELARSIENAQDLPRLREALGALRALSVQMLAYGASAGQLTGIITRLNDAALARVITLVTREQAFPVPVIWLAFGSEGRGEQTLATDQDNGLVLLSETDGSGRQTSLAVARAINEALDSIGFPLCAGNTMASNPQLCLSAAQWQQRLDQIIRSPTREHLLEATILFDARAAFGPVEPWRVIFSAACQQAKGHTRFLHALAQHALEWRPALNFLGELRTSKLARSSVIDLKKGAIQPIVSAVRVLALAHGLTVVNTEARLRALAQCGAILPDDARAWVEALGFVQLQRMRLNREQAESGQALDNQLVLQRLNPLDRRVLREALRQIERLQRRLKLDYAS